MLLSLIRLWTGPLPRQEIFPSDKRNPLLHWFIHPIKRHLSKLYLVFLKRVFDLKVIAITGSAGKTTTKNLLQSALETIGPTVSTKNNTTSTYNIPTTILNCSPLTKYLILEMSVEYPEDMDFYTWLATPDIAIFLNVGRTHTLHLSDPKNISFEKSKIFSPLSPTGVAVINSDDPLITPPINSKSCSFGYAHNSFCQILSATITKDFTTNIQLLINNQPFSLQIRLIGKQAAYNVAAALTALVNLGVNPDIVKSALESCPPPPRRFHPILLPNNCLIIDDTHNANPTAVSESINSVSDLAKLLHRQPILILSQMNELGQFETTSHIEIGDLIRTLSITKLLCIGPATKHTISAAKIGRYFRSQNELLTFLIKNRLVSPNTILLIKGSRSWHLENLVQNLIDLVK